jgi:nucleotide-binding universal stress UspA family protein
VAASLLRHVPAEAIYLGIHPVMSSESERAAQLRDLLDVRSAALAEHGLDMRTELRPGAVPVELQRELAAYEQSMLVIGTSSLDALQWDWLGSVLEGSPPRTVLFVHAARVEPLVEA